MGHVGFVRWAAIGLLGAVAASGIGCAAADDQQTDDSDELAVIARDPLAMPTTVLRFESEMGWGPHHLEWHTVRQWDLLQPSDQAWAKGQGWARAELQEGKKGNGLEFLAMHRVMIRTLKEKFPSHASLFAGWAVPPTDPLDKNDPVPNGATQPMDPSKVDAIDKMMNHLDAFVSDDDLGLFLETSLRPTSRDPSARCKDKSAGLHNSMHNRFMDPQSKIDIGDPSVNLQNKRFWRLHGWIESRWTAFRELKKLSDQDPAYQAAIKKAEDMLLHPPGAKAMPGQTPPPESLRKHFEQDPG
jgi:hypothetical protein